MADTDSIPELDWTDLESVHERVGHMLHSFARLLPPAAESLELPSRPVPRESKKLPKYSGIPRHRETWLQDMMNSFSAEPTTAKNTTLETGGPGIMQSHEAHPPFKPEDIAAQQAADMAALQKQQLEDFQNGIGSRLAAGDYHSAIMMAGGYSQAGGPYSRTFPQLQQQNFSSSDEQKEVSRTMVRRNNNRQRSMSPRNNNNINNNNNNRNRSQSQHNRDGGVRNNNVQRQGRARSNRNNNNNNNNDGNNRNQSKNNAAAKIVSTSPPAREPSKPKVVPGSQVALKPSKKQQQQRQQQAQQPQSEPTNNKNANEKGAAASAPEQPPRRTVPQEGDILHTFVEFKRDRIRKIPCTFPVETGQYVIVFGDRDFDMGLVIAKEYVDKDDRATRIGDIEWMDTVDATPAQLRNLRTERDPVIRVATPEESAHLQNDFTVFEENARKVCQYYCIAYGINIEILDAELQFDGKKISFFFNHHEAIDFRNLVKDLHKVFNARIWMENVNEAQRSGHVMIPPRKKEGSTGRAGSRGGNVQSRRSPHRHQSRGGRSRGSRSFSPTQNRGGEQQQQQQDVPPPTAEEIKTE